MSNFFPIKPESIKKSSNEDNKFISEKNAMKHGIRVIKDQIKPILTRDAIMNSNMIIPF